jgi:hypothetical protein
MFAERAFDMFQLRTGDASMLEAALVRNAQIFIDGGATMLLLHVKQRTTGKRVSSPLGAHCRAAA